jgi:histidinol dehydrogenase
MTGLAYSGSATVARGTPNGLQLRFRGAANALSGDDRRALFARALSVDPSLRSRVGEILARVRNEGDVALLAMARELDRASLSALEVPREALDRAMSLLSPALRRALERAAENIARVHRAFLPQTMETSPEPGIVIGRRPDPLERVGVYAPGGRAAYPSSVLMGVVPARVAGVEEIIVCSPPGPDGLPPTTVLAAAAIAGADRLFAIGGAGAVAAMAYGTNSVPRVDRIVGPGNAYVTEAKLQLAGVVGIDSPAGPSELLVIADDTSDPELVAREMIAQAEHDPSACVVAVVVGVSTATSLEEALARQIERAGRREIIGQALAGQGAVLSVETLSDAVEMANRYAPEHLLIALGDGARCQEVVGQARNAGTVFVGECASNAFGDYMTGANHVLPTLGLARSYSGLSILDFFRWTSYQRVERSAAARLADDVALLADAEGLPGHAAAARAWANTGAAPAARASVPNAIDLVRRDVASLSTYMEAKTAAGPPTEVAPELCDLSDNTNLWGAPPAAVAALRDAQAARYPTPYSGELKDALRRYVGVDAACIVTGCGSDDVLDATMRAFADPGDRIAYSVPTFSMIPALARVNGLRPLEIPLRDENQAYDVDADRLVESGAKIIYVCSPNNPTGTGVSRSSLERLVHRAPGIVILDEAYAEFAPTSNADLVRLSGRLVVTRTLSKAFGLAGLRIGYGIAARETVEFIERARGPYRVNIAAERAAFAALANTPDALGWVREHARLACENRDRFVAGLRQLGLAPLPSLTNFVLLPHANALELGRRLLLDGIIVRSLTNLGRDLAPLNAAAGCALRIGVGPWNIMTRVLDSLAAGIA